ncbi:DUF3141 domain-containing protein [Bradyrhizobium sp. WSM2254]|uniref:DUF3141 domain-containing protein n=1 Tax=Bradyrhizobium sp. WSM2254 TaxID=1188263 RepID=UPI003525EF51
MVKRDPSDVGEKNQDSGSVPFDSGSAAFEYIRDVQQCNLMFWDVMRQRGNQYREHQAETVPHFLDYAVELVVDGRTLERPVQLWIGSHRPA